MTDKELLEGISYLIDEDLDEYVKRSPVHNGKKVISERAWEALWSREFWMYEDKEVFTAEEHTEYCRVTREFGNRYECVLDED